MEKYRLKNYIRTAGLKSWSKRRKKREENQERNGQKAKMSKRKFCGFSREGLRKYEQGVGHGTKGKWRGGRSCSCDVIYFNEKLYVGHVSIYFVPFQKVPPFKDQVCLLSFSCRKLAYLRHKKTLAVFAFRYHYD